MVRAVKACTKAGLEVARVEFDSAAGKIVVITGKPSEAVVGNEVDQWLAKHHAHKTEGH